jgi:hypothetical protein
MPIETVPSNDRRESFTASAAQTVFPFDFPVYAAGDLRVTRRRAGIDTILAIGADYAVTGAGNQAGGAVTLTVGATAGDGITIESNMPIARTSALNNGGNLTAEQLNGDANRSVIVDQQLDAKLARTIRVPSGDTSILTELPTAAERALRLFGFDGAGNPIAVDTALGTALVTPFMETVLAASDAANARALLDVRSQLPLVVNGGFDVWQASTSLAIAAGATTTAAIYAADAWCMETSANQACLVSQQAGTGVSRYRARVQRNSGQTGVAVLRFQQPLEIWDVIKLRGQVVTATVTAKAGANFSGTLRMKLLTGTGTESRRTNAAAYTGEGTQIDAAMALSTTDATFSGTSGVIASNITQAAWVFEWTPSGTAGVADFFELQDFRVDFGASPAVMRHEPYQQVLARCQRLYWKTLGPLLYVGNAAAAAQIQALTIKLPVTMRVNPTVSLNFSGGVNVLGPNAGGNADIIQPYLVSNAAGTTAYTYDTGNTADARL